MMRSTIVTFLIAAAAAGADAQNAPPPEECIARPGESPAVVVSHDGKVYRLTSEACRAQFLSDPERYAQLYDALLELEREGTTLRARAGASLVPS